MQFYRWSGRAQLTRVLSWLPFIWFERYTVFHVGFETFSLFLTFTEMFSITGLSSTTISFSLWITPTTLISIFVKVRQIFYQFGVKGSKWITYDAVVTIIVFMIFHIGSWQLVLLFHGSPFVSLFEALYLCSDSLQWVCLPPWVCDRSIRTQDKFRYLSMIVFLLQLCICSIVLFDVLLLRGIYLRSTSSFPIHPIRWLFEQSFYTLMLFLFASTSCQRCVCVCVCGVFALSFGAVLGVGGSFFSSLINSARRTLSNFHFKSILTANVDGCAYKMCPIIDVFVPVFSQSHNWLPWNLYTILISSTITASTTFLVFEKFVRQ